MAIQNANVTTAASSIITSSGNTAIVTIHLCNYTASTITANLYLVPAGKTANATTIIYSNVSITSYNTLVIDKEKFILSNGDSLQANVNANVSLTATVSSIGI
jgi:hypothetical protein